MARHDRRRSSVVALNARQADTEVVVEAPTLTQTSKGNQLGANDVPQRHKLRALLPIALLLLVCGVAIGAWIEVDTANAPPHAESLSYSAVVDPVLVFNGITIAEAARIFNRRNEVQLIVNDPAIAKKKIGGSFHTHQPELFASALKQSLPGIVVVHDGKTIRLDPAVPPDGAGVKTSKHIIAD